MSSDYIPAIITASVALSAAVGAQFLSHSLQNKRIDKEDDNRAYQELIFPFLPEILLFYETETDFRRESDVVKNVDVQNLIERIGGKVQYSDMKLLFQYNELVKSEYFYDAKGDVKEINTLRFFYAFLSYLLDIIGKKNHKEESFVNQIDLIRKKYGVWILVSEEIGYEFSIEVMSFEFVLPINFYCCELQNTLNKLVFSSGRPSDSIEGYRTLKNFSDIITTELGGNWDGSPMGELQYRLLENSIK